MPSIPPAGGADTPKWDVVGSPKTPGFNES